PSAHHSGQPASRATTGHAGSCRNSRTRDGGRRWLIGTAWAVAPPSRPSRPGRSNTVVTACSLFPAARRGPGAPASPLLSRRADVCAGGREHDPCRARRERYRRLAGTEIVGYIIAARLGPCCSRGAAAAAPTHAAGKYLGPAGADQLGVQHDGPAAAIHRDLLVGNRLDHPLPDPH